MSVEIDGDDTQFQRGPRRSAPDGAAPLRVIDLFSGVGGMTIGAEAAARGADRRLEIALAVDLRPEMARAYRRNFEPALGDDRPDVRAWFDRTVGSPLSKIERGARERIGPVDLVLAGPPCQGHSSLNNHTRGDDPKNELYDAVVRSAEVLQARALLIENVPALARDQRGTLERALRDLESLGYHTAHGIVGMVDIGVPQLRRRHVVLAAREREPNLATAVARCHVAKQRTVEWAIRDLVGTRSHRLVDIAAEMSEENLRRAKFLISKDVYDLPNPRRPRCQQSQHKYKSMYGRLRWNAPAQTITTGFGSPGQGRYIHPSEPRTITPHEAARLQFFPDWFDFSTFVHRRILAAAIGNAVPPKLVFALVRELLVAPVARGRPGKPRLYVAPASVSPA